MEQIKICSKCKASLPIHQFSKNKSSRDGLQGRCVRCHRAAVKACNAANPERSRAAARAWVQANPERAKAQRAAYYLNNKSRLRALQSAREKNNRPKYSAIRKNWALAHIDRARAISNKAAKKASANLTNSVVANYLVRGTSMRPSDVPKELIEAKREQWKLVRLIKEKRK